MPILRTTITKFGKVQGKDTATITVRASTKAGAMMLARFRALQTMPIREQDITRVENLSNDRLLDKWVVDVQDKEEMSALGR